MLYAISFSLVLSVSAFASSDAVPKSMARTIERATKVIQSQESKKERFKILKTLRETMTLTHKKNLGRGKNSYKARYFYFVMKPVLKVERASQCDEVRHQVLYIDSGPAKVDGPQEVMPETQYALDLLDAVCG